MSEQNILNPTVGDNLNPDYSYTEGLPNMMSSFQAKSGSVVTRQILARGRVYDLQWQNRPKTTADALRTWEAQYRADFFSYFDQERNRYFSGRFAGPPQISPAGFNKWNIQAQFVEIPKLPMFAYSANWQGAAVQDSIFLQELDGFQNNLVKLTGSWSVLELNAFASGGSDYFTNTTNDYAEWLYYGYGFRLWERKQANLGIVAVSRDGGAETNVDLYNAGGAIGSAAVYVDQSVPLGFHRVKVRCTGTKNAGSSGFFIYADAIEVMQ